MVLIGFSETLSLAQSIGIVGTMVLTLYFSKRWMCAHAYAMRQRKVLDDNEWSGWLQWMKNCFRKGAIGSIWKQIESDRWFNPAFQNFINSEIVTTK